jgi:hypothetical protein
MAKKKLNPAELVAKRFGGTCIASKLLGYTSMTVVTKWIERGGAIRDQKRVLTKAKQLGIPFTAEECIHGGYAE